MTGDTVTQPHRTSCTPARAARELGMRRREFDLAVHLGRIRTVPDEGGGGARRVARSEIERLRSSQGFPESVLDRVRTVGTGEGAALMRVSPGRFTRLARLGLVVPVFFYLNRYRAVVWMYSAEELRQFAADEAHTPLLKARTPEGLRGQLEAGLDLRPRNWRGRQLGFLLRQSDDPWQRAGAVAAFLDPARIAETVLDPGERAHLSRHRPGPPTHGAPGSPAARLCEQIMTADDADEVDWLLADLTRAMAEARAHRPAPRTTPETGHRATTPGRQRCARAPRLLGWLRRRNT
ncbi:DUF6397 family protein [Streptomyces sp. NPDC003832]